MHKAPFQDSKSPGAWGRREHLCLLGEKDGVPVQQAIADPFLSALPWNPSWVLELCPWLSPLSASLELLQVPLTFSEPSTRGLLGAAVLHACCFGAHFVLRDP